MTSPIPQAPTSEYALKPVKIDVTSSLIDEIRNLTPVLERELLNAPRVKYSEERFAQYFAGYFLGVVEVPPNVNIYTTWAAEVGSLHTEVDIVDRFDPSVVLFTVPPFMNTNGISMTGPAQDPVRFNKINVVYDENSRNFPTQATNAFYQHVSEKLVRIFRSNAHDPVSTAKWLKIFQFYNVVPPVDANAAPVVKPPGTPAPAIGFQPTAINNGWGNVSNLNFDPTID